MLKLLKTLDLNDVRIFAASAEMGTLSAAAKDMGVPPSTVSRSLTRLEKHLGVLLVRRTTKGLALTDAGREYLGTCKRALRVLRDGGNLIENQRSQPTGLLKITCPITMARDLLAPLLKEFLRRYPDLRVEIEPYTSGWDQEPREDVDVFFKVRAPKDSLRRIRPYPGTARGIYASHSYVEAFGMPSAPEELAAHRCIGSGLWKLNRGTSMAVPDVEFRVMTDDPQVHLTLTVQGVGISVLPHWMAGWPEVHNKLVPILPQWKPKPITLCALFSGQSRLTPKVQVLLDFLGEYIGTDRDPRLRQKWEKWYFAPLSAEAASK